MKLYFPDKFNDYAIILYYENVKAKTQLILQEMLGQEISKDIEFDVNDFFNNIMKPRYLLHDKNNEVVMAEKNFEKSCTIIEDNGIHNPKLLTVFEFYSKIEFLEYKFKANK